MLGTVDRHGPRTQLSRRHGPQFRILGFPPGGTDSALDDRDREIDPDPKLGDLYLAEVIDQRRYSSSLTYFVDGTAGALKRIRHQTRVTDVTELTGSLFVADGQAHDGGTRYTRRRR
jgi:hypothetical protein